MSLLQALTLRRKVALLRGFSFTEDMKCVRIGASEAGGGRVLAPTLFGGRPEYVWVPLLFKAIQVIQFKLRSRVYMY